MKFKAPFLYGAFSLKGEIALQLSMCNDVNRGHKSGHSVLFIYEGNIFIRQVDICIGFSDDCFTTSKQVRMTQNMFFKVASALWKFRKRVEGSNATESD